MALQASPIVQAFMIVMFFIILGVTLFVKRMVQWTIIGCVLLTMLSFYYNEAVDRANISSIPLQAEEESVAWECTIVSKVEVDGDRAMMVVKSGNEKLQVIIRLQSETEQQEVDTWQRGDKLILTGVLKRPSTASNFGAFDYRDYLYRQHIHWLFEVEGINEIQFIEQEKYVRQTFVYLLSQLDYFRAKLHEQTAKLFPPEQAGWMSSLLFGYRDDLLPEQYEAFAGIGISHVLAISGLHVGLIIALLYGVLIRIGVTRERARLICMMVTPMYIVLTGAEPPVVRAGLMAMIGLELLRRDRLKDGLAVMCIVGWFMLLWNPYYLFHIGYQLSFIITGALILAVPRVHVLLPNLPYHSSSLFAVTLVAQLASLPITLSYFHMWSWTSLPANLILVPFIASIVLPLGLCSLVLSFVWLEGAKWVAQVIAILNDQLLSAVEGLRHFDPFGWVTISPPVWWMIAYYGICILLLLACEQLRSYPNVPFTRRMERSRQRYHIAVGVCLALFTVLWSYIDDPYRFDRSGAISVLDVGQGDAIFVRTPQGKHLLIDTGGTISFATTKPAWQKRQDPFEVGEDVVVPLLKQRGIDRIDYLLLTHADQDHIGGAQAVLESIPVRSIIMNGTLRKNASVARVFPYRY